MTSIFTDGELHATLDGRGLCLHRGSAPELVLDGDALGLVDSDRPLVLGICAAAGEAIVVDGDGRALLVPLRGDDTPFALPLRVLAAVALDAERWAVALVARVKGRDVTKLGIGRLPRGAGERFPHVLDPGRPERASWPVPVAPTAWSRARCAVTPEPIRLDRNRFGIALTCAESGTIAWARPHARTFERVIRVPIPATPGVLWASCTERGIVIGSATRGGPSFVVALDRDARIAAHRVGDGLGLGAVTDEGVVVVAEGGSLTKLDAATLERTAARRVDGLTSLDALALAPDGALAAVVGGGRALLVSLREGVSGETELEAPCSRPTSRPPPPAGAPVRTSAPPPLERVAGPAQLSLDPTRALPEWTFCAGGSFDIELPLVNVGGPIATGLYVELGGEAVDRGLVAPTEACVETVGEADAVAPFTRARPARSELEGLDLHAGVVLPAAKKVEERFRHAPDDIFFCVRIRGTAGPAGRGLLTVRIGVLGEGTHGSLLRGRAIEVHD